MGDLTDMWNAQMDESGGVDRWQQPSVTALPQPDLAAGDTHNELAEKLLKPHAFRVVEHDPKLGGIKVESSAVPYWDAVRVLTSALAAARKEALDEAATLAANKYPRYVTGWDYGQSIATDIRNLPPTEKSE